MEKKCAQSFKFGFVAIIARPNVGKSTLLNKITGQKIAITTPVAQTTRKNIKGIYTDSNSQIVFIDTPGIHKPLNKLGEALSEQSKSVLEDTDLILFLSDVSGQAGRGDKWIVENYLKNLKTPVLLVLNKADLIKDLAKRELNTYSYKSLFEIPPDTVKISAKTGRNINDLIEKIKNCLPEGGKMYDEDEVTDQTMREIAAEVVREKIIFSTKDEIPHSVAVIIENYKEEENIDRISAQIIVSNDSQKKILIGKGGSMLKKIGTASRLELEKIAQKKVFLELFVKVVKNWQKDPAFIKTLGLDVK
ncbi:TPA: GTPase Era [Candidatus Galligastranaerophilus faecipullorum]|nr:GTPase Era [Candidatus Galligastranaerophilus faecipullorum]